ncbi:MAG: ankyrin repeat domain-containing protein (plasmid) [Candidatus Cardinium sp.]|uniref:ankyrin repeat domain-containing protein n=1 Tax=Cardinium endosymbiont of Dermatophagoides farinae TaxID=2597823 RepID=UPI001182F5E4|nr:ankyrin repeat domain-containing protein [Cardinium endosymbiont of Dermatophagoides farinae]TSJ80112.1 RING domain containing protein [Cardinium endosymbiont of Dermatophagoides farinae]UWW97530.1 MAG: ankyrin repeat domain-containing protein [Candidatus Cardinium sp.]UWW97566.1 MAG: ankyrin repeat domain-containing protein [Candidatus Cardinium sp.]
MKLSLCYLYFLAYNCLATTCWETKVKPKVEHNQLNQKKDSDKNGQESINEMYNRSMPPLYKSVGLNDLKETKRLLDLGADPNFVYKDDCPLYSAVCNENEDMVALLLSYGAKVISQGDGKSNILDAVRYKKNDASKRIYNLLVSKLSSEEVVRLNVQEKKEQDINEVKNESTPLLWAVIDNDLPKVKELLSLGANPNITNVHSNPLEIAVRNKNKEMVSLLLSYGAEVRFDKNGISSVFNSLEVNNNQEILDVVLCHFADIGKKDSVGLTPIHWACRDGHLNVVKHILDKSPFLVHNTDNPYKFTPLHWAARRGFKEIVELLIAKGASKAAKSKSGFTPLMLAIANKHKALEGILSPDGFSRHSKWVDKDWQCSICIEGVQDSKDKIFPFIPLDCSHKFHFRCITMHVLNQRDNNQTINCPLCRGNLSVDMIQKIVSSATNTTMSAFSTLNAVRQKDMSRLKLLLAKGGNPNESTISGAALEEAVRQSNYEMVSLLLDYGADPTYQDPRTNNTPLHYAADNMLFERTSQDVSDKIFISLIKHGAMVNSKNVKCKTPRDLVCSFDDPLFVLTEAGSIRSGYFDDIQPVFGLSGSKIKQKILFGKELEHIDYHAKL